MAPTTHQIKMDLVNALMERGLTKKITKQLLGRCYHNYTTTGDHEVDIMDAVERTMEEQGEPEGGYYP